MKIRVNGQPASTISALDRGLAYGDGLFETMRVSNGKIPLLKEHLARLSRDCVRLYLSEPNYKHLEEEINSLCQDQNEGVLKLIYTRGEGGHGYRLPAQEHNHYLLILKEYQPISAEQYDKGIAITIANTRLSRNTLLAGIKHLNKLEYVLAAKECDENQYHEMLLLDTEENIIEGLAMNIFVVANGVVYTPDLSWAGVAGVMRQCLLDYARSLNIDCQIKNMRLSDLNKAEEIFLTNSIVGVLPVNKIIDQDFSVGPIGRKFQQYCKSIF